MVRNLSSCLQIILSLSNSLMTPEMANSLRARTNNVRSKPQEKPVFHNTPAFA